ncbi:HhH-GPD domain-containing protein [Cephalotus follicularis]|uniref:Adenine DNA glycosylase n=1 Tax=Cephalotus follicularis TaxID=3775 RepID=A0A1Q3BK84_CEPFO|nr:HhH-GPD domain-containing protein [Cephalotus follicularis]
MTTVSLAALVTVPIGHLCQKFEISTVASVGIQNTSEQTNKSFCFIFSPTSFSTMEPQKERKQPVSKGEKQTTRAKVPLQDIEDLFSKKETQKIRGSLLGWYDKYQRELPWRSKEEKETEEESETRAYQVWVSEVMLQQTRVQTVIDYYNRWMRRWPTLHHLAQASLEEVNEMWAGLGYYRRARFLLEGAKMVVAWGGEFPNTVSALRKVRGIGDYTAGAIASIAFGEAVPVVDGNVIRVLARLKAIAANPKDSITIKNFWKLATQLVDPCRPGDFNQSLMELGATLCTPSSPSCSSCPVSGQCRALATSKQDTFVQVTDYPTKVLKAKQRSDFSAVCVVEILEGKNVYEENQSDSRFIIVKRPDDGLLAGLWEFPSVMLDKEADSSMRREAIDQFLKKSFGLNPNICSIVSREYVGEFVHVFTHIRLKIYVELLVLRLQGGKDDWFGKHKKKAMLWKCVDSKELSSMGLTSGVKKVYAMIQKFKQNVVPANSVPSRKRSRRNNGSP